MNIPQLPQLPFLTRNMTKFLRQSRLQLRISVAADTANPVILRGFTRNGMINREVTPPATGERQVATIGIDDIPIMLSIVDSGNSFAHGECYASVSLDIDGKEAINLCSGYVYQETGPTWPAISVQNSIPGRGHITEFLGTNQAAGSEISETVPAGELWLLHAMSSTLVTDATSATRTVKLITTGPAGLKLRTWSGGTQTASQTIKYTFAKIANPADALDGDDIQIPIAHDHWIGPEGTIKTETDSFQAGDDWAAPIVLVEKFVARA